VILPALRSAKRDCGIVVAESGRRQGSASLRGENEWGWGLLFSLSVGLTWRGALSLPEYRQAAGAIAERLNVMREQMKGSDRCFRCAPKLGLDYCFGVVSAPPRRFSRRSWRPARRA
jgi:hypothetical protein